MDKCRRENNGDNSMTSDPRDKIDGYCRELDLLRQEIGRVIVGQEHLIDRMLAALVTGGHILLEGVPGLAKTTAVRSLSRGLGLSFQRISFTPDLLPADVIGTLIYRDGDFLPRKGPVFTNLLLADEINRAPAKVQSALLEAMQERQVTIGDTSYALPEPFLVMATQNPIEHEGTYPLPEAQVDRFMFKCKITYPERDEERRMMQRFCGQTDITINPVLTADKLAGLRALYNDIYCDDKVREYILDLVRATREPARFNLSLDPYIEIGASPRAALFLQAAGRARAMMSGRSYTTPQDIKDVAHDILRHRIILTYEAEAENVTADDLIDRVLSALPVP